MLKLQKFALIAMCTFAMYGCDKKNDYDYLVSHPQVLNTEVSYCQGLENETAEQASYCQTVMFAASNFISVLNEWRESQEQFGSKVLKAQEECVKAAEGVQTARVELEALQDKNADAESIGIAKDKLELALKDSEEKSRKVKTMLGVLSLSTPE